MKPMRELSQLPLSEHRRTPMLQCSDLEEDVLMDGQVVMGNESIGGVQALGKRSVAHSQTKRG